MFGNNVATTGLTFSKVLGGISKTLSIANQVIPLYQQAKPMINNAKTIMSVLKGLNKKETQNQPTNKTTEKETQNIEKKELTDFKNAPSFFQ